MIYPPTLNSTQVAFLASTSEYHINFTLNRITNESEIGHIEVRIVKKDENTSVVNTINNNYPDGIIYKDKSSMKQTDIGYYVPITSTDIGYWAGDEYTTGWLVGQLYKVQIRFGLKPLWTSSEKFSDWKQEQIEKGWLSEWSTVMLIKAIDEPKVMVINQETSEKDPDTLILGIEPTTMPTFMGSYSISAISSEPEDKYKFDIYDKDNKLYDTSGWLQHTEAKTDQHIFNKILLNREEYSVVYSVITKNGYEAVSKPYEFLVSETKLNMLAGVSFEVEEDHEDGRMNFYLSGRGLNGCYVITRTSEKSDFTIYEDIKFLTFFNRTFYNQLVFQDYTVESGIRYIYAFQLINSEDVRTAPLYEKGQSKRVVDFEYSYLYHDGIQLKLKLNQKISSFKHTVLTNKQDTLGDKYPHLSKNGYAYYAEFPLSGTISIEMDDTQTFLTEYDDGYFQGDDAVIPADKFHISKVERDGSIEPGPQLVIDRNLTPDNIFIERKFREKVEEFLNNFDYKLYKSPTEGNIVVVLQNVSMTPNATLGRMIFDFSATAYEVLDNTLDKLNEYKVINIGKFQKLDELQESIQSFGQIADYFEKGTDLLETIRKQEEIPVSNNYRLKVKKITDVSFQAYPRDGIDELIVQLKAEYAAAAKNGEPLDDLRQQIEKYETIRDSFKDSPETKSLRLSINGKTIAILPGRMYQLKDIVEDIFSVVLESDTAIIMNYVCDLIQVEDTVGGVISSVEVSRIWGQINGLFTEVDYVLKNYDSDYKNSETYRIYDTHEPGRDEIHIYKSYNLFDIIQEEARKQVALNHNLTDGFNHYDEETDLWDSNGDIYHHFDDITSFIIEADPGTVLYLAAAGADQPQRVTIGPTGRYELHPADNLITYAMFDGPTFAIINYVCNTTQVLMKKG